VQLLYAQSVIVSNSGGSAMVELQTILIVADAVLFFIVGLVLFVRLREAKGSLFRARVCVVLASFSAGMSFVVSVLMALAADPSSTNLLLKQLYVFEDLFAMLILSLLASFAVFATYAGSRRNLIIVLFFLVSLIPPSYLTLNYNLASVTFPIAGHPELFSFTSPPLTKIIYALCGIPLGLVPIVAFARSVVIARRRKDKVLSSRSAIMFSAVVLNEGVYLFYVFGYLLGTISDLLSIIAWIPAALFLLFAVLKITSPVKRIEET
jgi:hypothetical protein